MVKKTKEKEAPKAVPTDLFGKQVSVLEKEFGDRVLESLSTIKSRPIVRTSTGSLGLDSIISAKIGGMRNGRLLQIWGPPSGGKTTLAIQTAANITAAKKRVIFYDAERTFDPDIAIAAGVDPEYFHVLRKPAEESINIIFRILQTGEVGGIIIDSISSCRPTPVEKDGKELDITREQIAYHASFIAKWISKLTDICADNDVFFTCINQQRNQLGTYMGGTKAASGGYAFDHAISASLKVTGGHKADKSRILDSEGRVVGQYITCICDKSKIDVPRKEVTLPLFFGLGVNPFMELASLATDTGVITLKGAYYYLSDDIEAGYICQGMQALVDRLFQDNEFFKALRVKVIKALGLQYPEGAPFVNPFLNEDLTPKAVTYREEKSIADEPAVG